MLHIVDGAQLKGKMTKNKALFDLSKAIATLHYTSSCTPQKKNHIGYAIC